MNEKCESIREELALTGRAPESESMREHVSSCPDCAQFLENLLEIESRLQTIDEKDVSDEVVAKLLARRELAVKSRRPQWRTLAAALATAASLVLGFSLLLDRGQMSFRLGPESGDLQQPSKNEAGDRVAPSREIVPVDEDHFAEDISTAATPPPPPPPPPAAFVEDKRLDSTKEKLAEFNGRSQTEVDLGKKSDLKAGLEYEVGLADRLPAKTFHRDPVYPAIARDTRVAGTVILEIEVERDGNVTEARVVESIPLLDQAAIDAVRQWKYEPVESDALRVFRVPVAFELPKPEDTSLFLLEERARVEGLRFREATGYWSNTYLPGDPMLRQLERRLAASGTLPVLHRGARPALLPFDPSQTSALSLFVHADRSGISTKSRLLVQVGIRARDHHGRRRPPMNVGVVLHLPETISAAEANAVTSLVQSLASSREPGDRFRVVATGAGGREVSPEEFQYGPLSVALREWFDRPAASSSSVTEALARTLESVHAGDDPTMPLGTSVVLLVSGRNLDSELGAILPMAQRSALGGVSVSAIGFGAGSGDASLERLALSGQGRLYSLARAEEASDVVERELTSASRAVARALRLRIQLAEGVRLVAVLGSEPLSERAASRVRAEERSIDLRLARNLGIEADRGDDEDGIQIVIPTFYAGDAHSILLDVVAEGPGAIAEVTARYKDLVQLDNTVARASLALPRAESVPGPLEASVIKDYLGYRLSEALRASAAALAQGDLTQATLCLEGARSFLSRFAATDSDLSRDVALLDGYLTWLPRLSAPHEREYLTSSLLYASALKRLSTTTAAS